MKILDAINEYFNPKKIVRGPVATDLPILAPGAEMKEWLIVYRIGHAFDSGNLVINFYRTLKNHFPDLKRLINATLISRRIHREALDIILKHKREKPQKTCKLYRVRLAWAFWLCTNFAYSNKIGGGYKYSNNMSVSVPDTLKRRKEQFTELLVSRIEHAYIENEDAIYVLNSRNVDKAFHYLDPPYAGSDQGHYAGYTWEDYAILLNWLESDCLGKFMLSNYNSQVLEEYIIRNGWQKKEITHRIQAPRRSASHKTEVLVWNYTNVCGTQDIFKN
ncbi:MAG TPA: DNA adenine methylase [Saprospiraceae bacterium]|nr:DNA adenine methylase [Saprospiraceae bacterium]